MLQRLQQHLLLPLGISFLERNASASVLAGLRWKCISSSNFILFLYKNTIVEDCCFSWGKQADTKLLKKKNQWTAQEYEESGAWRKLWLMVDVRRVCSQPPSRLLPCMDGWDFLLWIPGADDNKLNSKTIVAVVVSAYLLYVIIQ